MISDVNCSIHDIVTVHEQFIMIYQRWLSTDSFCRKQTLLGAIVCMMTNAVNFSVVIDKVRARRACQIGNHGIKEIVQFDIKYGLRIYTGL